MKRRTLIKTAGLTALSAFLPGPIGQVLPAQAAESRLPASGPLSGRRILTFNSVIRVNQSEQVNLDIHEALAKDAPKLVSLKDFIANTSKSHPEKATSHQ